MVSSTQHSSCRAAPALFLSFCLPRVWSLYCNPLKATLDTILTGMLYKPSFSLTQCLEFCVTQYTAQLEDAGNHPPLEFKLRNLPCHPSKGQMMAIVPWCLSSLPESPRALLTFLFMFTPANGRPARQRVRGEHGKANTVISLVPGLVNIERWDLCDPPETE